MKRPIYLDYNATTPVDADVVEAMLPYFNVHYGNPSSKRHAYGWTADEAVTVAREQVAHLVGAEPDWVHFTGGATEAINWAIKGFAEANEGRGRHLVAVATEHHAVLHACEAMVRRGWELTIVDVDGHGRADTEELRGAMRDDTVLVCCMWANNEIGAIHPVGQLVDVAHEFGAAVLVDATQTVGKVPVALGEIDLLACSAHKFYGPKGVGALVINGRRPRLRLFNLIDGGGQEHGRRAGTTNVPGVVGMGAAAEKAQRLMTDELARTTRLRDRLEQAFTDARLRFTVNGGNGPRLPNTCSVTFDGVDTAKMIAEIPMVAVSTGSACSTGSGKASHVLTAIGSDLQSATLRISVGRHTTTADVDEAAAAIVGAVSSLQPVLQA